MENVLFQYFSSWVPEEESLHFYVEDNKTKTLTQILQYTTVRTNTIVNTIVFIPQYAIVFFHVGHGKFHCPQ